MSGPVIRLLRPDWSSPLHLVLHLGLLLALLLVVTVTPVVNARPITPSGLPFYRTSIATPEWLSAREVDAATMHRIASFALTDQSGLTISNADVDGRIHVVSFFFTTCRGLCPNLYTNLSAVLRAFPGDTNLRVLSHTVTPEIDDVAALASYATSHHIRDPRWRLLTGQPSEIRRLALDSYFVQLGDTTGNAKGTMLHTETVVLVDGRGRIRGLYDGSLAFDTQRLTDDIRTLRSRSDQICSLLCDPRASSSPPAA